VLAKRASKDHPAQIQVIWINGGESFEARASREHHRMRRLAFSR